MVSPTMIDQILKSIGHKIICRAVVQTCKQDVAVQDQDKTEISDFYSETRLRPSKIFLRQRRD